MVTEKGVVPTGFGMAEKKDGLHGSGSGSDGE
jgi:hypothetical protein